MADCLLHADAFCPSRDLSNSLLEPIHRLRSNHALDLRASRKAEPKKLPLPRSRHRAPRLIHLELFGDESRDALHHPLPHPPARCERTCYRSTLKLVEHVSTEGKTPPNFTFDPSGNWLSARGARCRTPWWCSKVDAETGPLTRPGGAGQRAKAGFAGVCAGKVTVSAASPLHHRFPGVRP
jgi:hypothetical protein